MLHTFGKTHHQYLRMERTQDLGLLVDDAVRVITASNAQALIDGWNEEDHPSTRPGRKPHATELTVIALMLIQARTNSDMRWNALDRTMQRLTAEQQIKIWARDASDRGWYHVLRRSYARLEMRTQGHVIAFLPRTSTAGSWTAATLI